jgi:hypothetical protein
MKSRITIEVDFDNGNLPVIQILRKDSDDVRDRLVSQFLQSLQHTSRWCKILYEGEFQQHGDQTNVQRWKVSPLMPSDLAEEIKLMETVLSRPENQIKQ